MSDNYFSIMRDNTFPYFCQACLVGVPEISPDPRYCRDCYDFLLKEAEVDHQGGGNWKPVMPGKENVYKPHTASIDTNTTDSLDAGDEAFLVASSSKKTQAYQKEAVTPILPVRGRPQKEVPIELIQRLSNEGLSIGRIVGQLKAVHQILILSNQFSVPTSNLKQQNIDNLMYLCHNSGGENA